MPLAPFNATIVNQAGEIVPGAEVEVRRTSDNGLADLYSDAAGTTSITNPFNADATTAFAQFYAEQDEYTVAASTGAGTITWVVNLVSSPDLVQIQSNNLDTDTSKAVKVSGFGLGGQTEDFDADASGLVTRFGRLLGNGNGPDGITWHSVMLSRALDAQGAQIAVRDGGAGDFAQMAIRHRAATGAWVGWEEVYTTGNIDEKAQATDTDLTAGQFLIPGSFGLGVGLPTESTIPFSDYFGISGFLKATSTINNPPDAPIGSRYWNGFVASGGLRSSQIITEQNNRTFSRVDDNGVVSTWREFYTTGNAVGTVSDDGSGVPNGALFQIGNTVNGQFTRFADGTLLCRHTLVLPFNNSANCQATWTYPFAFAVSPEITATLDYQATTGTITPSFGSLGALSHNINGGGLTAVNIRQYLANSNTAVFASGDQVTVHVKAEGRWKV